MTNLTPRPIKDRVIVRQDPKKNKIGMIYTPDGSEEYPCFGTVEAVGSTVTCVAVGDRVLFQRKPSSALCRDWREGDPEGWRDLLNLPEGHIMAVVTEEA